MKTTKKPIYRTQLKNGNMVADHVFGAKMEKLAKAYKRWDIASTVVFNNCERWGWDEVYDSNGFDKADRAMDILAKRFNACFKTSFTGEELACSSDLDKAYFCAINHGLI